MSTVKRPVLRSVGPDERSRPLRIVSARRRKPEPEPTATPIAHPFIVESIRILCAGQMREIDPRAWPKYGWEIRP